MKKFLSVLFILLALICVITITSCDLQSSQSTTTASDLNNLEEKPNKAPDCFEFSLNEDGESYSLTGIADCVDKEVDIPDTYNGKPITNIAEDAFVWNDTITSVTIPNTVTNIERHAFFSCSALITITIPASVTNIGEFAFADCVSIENIDVDENNQYYKSMDGNLYTKNGETLIQYAIGKSEELFVVPDTVQYIYDYALMLSKSLKNVIIPSSVKSIGFSALQQCERLENIEVDENNQHYKSIDGNLYNFDGTALIQYAIGKKNESFIVPDFVTNIEYAAFWECDNLKTVEISNSVTSIGDSAFVNCVSLKNITIPNSVTYIGENAFCGCKSLESIVIPDGVLKINLATFQYCISLESVVLPESLTYIDAYAFLDCTSIKSIIIPDSVEIISAAAFKNCQSLTNVIIGSGIMNIGDHAFKGCASLTSVTLKTTSDWFYMDLPDSTDLVSISVDLSNPQIVAKYLTNDYCDYQWIRIKY